MDREKAIKLLLLDLNWYKGLYAAERNVMERKYLRNKIEAFEYAIKELEKTAHEVPVQEQQSLIKAKKIKIKL